MSQGGFIAGDDGTGKGGGDHQEEQPGHSLLVGLHDAGLEIGLVGRQDRGHLFDILCSLFFQDIDNVIDGDDTDHTVLLVDNGHGREVVFLESPCGFLLVGQGIDTDDIVVHDLSDDVIGIEDDQIPQSDRSYKDPLFIQDITGVNSLGIQPDFTDPLNGVSDRHVLPQIHILDGHDTAGRILRILEQEIDIGPGIGTGVGQDLFDDVGRHFLQHVFQQVSRVIRHQVIDDGRRFLVGQGLNDILLVIGFQIGEDICRHILGEETEHLEGILILHLIHDGRYVRGLHFRRRLAEFGIFFLLQHFQQELFVIDILIHTFFLLLLHKQNDISVHGSAEKKPAEEVPARIRMRYESSCRLKGRMVYTDGKSGA